MPPEGRWPPVWIRIRCVSRAHRDGLQNALCLHLRGTPWCVCLNYFILFYFFGCLNYLISVRRTWSRLAQALRHESVGHPAHISAKGTHRNTEYPTWSSAGTERPCKIHCFIFCPLCSHRRSTILPTYTSRAKSRMALTSVIKLTGWEQCRHASHL